MTFAVTEKGERTMTCRNCFKFSDCLEWESTKYYGLDACCNNVESVCEDFKNKADFVEVVRCEKCQFVHINKDSCTYHCKRRGFFSEEVMPTDFCSYGVRKNENSN